MNKLVKASLGGLFSLSALSVSTSASAIVIDDFSTAQGGGCASTSADKLCVSGDLGVTSSSSYVTGGGILSGERDVKIDLDPTSTTINGKGASVAVFFDPTVNENKFTWSNATGQQSTVTIQWDGDDGQLSGDPENVAIENAAAPWDTLNLADGNLYDFTADGSESISVNVFSADQNFGFTFNAYDGSGNSATFSGTAEGTNTPVTRYYQYNNFTADAGFDFSAIDAFEAVLSSDGVGEIDLSIGLVTTSIPEPSTIALLASGLFGVGFMTRRRKSNSK